MNTIHIAQVVLLCGVLGACGHLTQTAPRASIGDFTDYVLEPLALRVADEKISEHSAALKFEHTPKAAIQTVAGLLHEVPWVGKLAGVMTVSQKAQLDEELAWLETRRIPLKRELLTLFVSRTSYKDETFTFCVNGVERRYQGLDINRFTRLPDGPGPCVQTQLVSLRKT